MRQMNSILPVLLSLALFFTLAGSAYSADYQHSIDVDKMKFSWSIDGDKLAASVSGPTTSWVAVGFNPTKAMKDANIIIGIKAIKRLAAKAMLPLSVAVRRTASQPLNLQSR